MGKKISAATPALANLTRAGIEHTVRTYEHTAAGAAAEGYGLEAAHALGVDPARVFKTLMVDCDGAKVLAVVPVDSLLDVKALASARGGKKAALVPVADAERISGSVAGGISPAGGRTPLPTVVDDSAQQFDTIVVSAGRRGLDVELSASDLVALTRGRFAPIRKST
ncbi:Cys-tRNA(Pro) deacylase [Micrococcales bacterium 31B]|nr:Cys-tRNA(Pro) deacylase [Micrococcales bacterium 31B]